MISNKLKYLISFLLLVCTLSNRLIGRSTPNDCSKAELKAYADSLEQLLLAYQPMQAFQISDSLSQFYGNLDCPVVISIKAAKGDACELLYNFEAALKVYNELIKIAVKNQFIEEEVKIRLSFARVYETISRPKLCLENLNKAKALIDKHDLKAQLSRYYIRSSSYQRIFEDKTLAREYAMKAIRLGKEYGVARSVADGNLLMGIITEDFEEGIQYSQQASKLFFELGDYKGGMAQQINIALRYLRRGDFDKTLAILDTVNTYTESITNNDKLYYSFKMRIAKIKADIFESRDDKDELIESLKAYNEYSELFGFLVNQEHINQLLIENAVSQEKEKVKVANRQNKLLLLGLLFLGGITILLTRLYWQNTSRKNKIGEQSSTITKQFNELEKLYNYQSTLLSEVHHRIKNNLQLIISLLALQNDKLEDNTQSGILEMLCNRINSISLIHEQLYHSKEFEKVDVGIYADNLSKNFLSLVSGKDIRINCKINDIQLNLDTTMPLGLIWSELISNSLKYNKNKAGLVIFFELVKTEDGYSMHYQDNGQGYPKGQFSANKLGMGYKIVHSLAKQLSAKTNTYNSDGAHFTLLFEEKIISPL